MRKQRDSIVLDEMVTAPVGAVVLHFGIDSQEGPFAYTRACLALGIVRKREVHYPKGDGFDRIGARLDWGDSIVPLHNMIVDESFDYSIDENTMIATPLTSVWEIQQKLGDVTDEPAERESLGEHVFEALRRVGIYPQ